MPGSSRKCSFFGKKEPKKLTQLVKFFWFFFSKKRTLLLPFLLFLAGAGDRCDTLVIPPGVGVGSPADVTAFNPLLVTSLYNEHVADYLFANLLWLDKDDRIDFSRSIATKIEVFDDDTRYRVTLRPWQWSDGKPVTADDVLYTWELIQKFGTNFAGYGQGGVPTMIKNFTVLNPEQFEITLNQPVNPDWFELGGLTQFTPLPRHDWGRLTTDELFGGQSNPKLFSVVDGPMQIGAYNIGRSITMVDNAKYPLEHLQFKRMVEKFLESGGAELQGIQSGEVDLANLPPEAFDAGKLVRNVHLVVEPPAFTFFYVGLNFKNPRVTFFNDVSVRQAIQDAIDQKAMIKALWHGYGVEAYSPVPANPDTYLSPRARSGKLPVGFNPAKANALLDQAGYKRGADGIRSKNGIRLEFTLTVPSGTINELMIGQFMQPELRKIGIVMRIQMEDFNQMMATISQGIAPWESYMLFTSLGPYPSGELIFQTGGNENWGGYSDPKMDRLIEDSVNKPGLDALFQYEDYATEQQPSIFLPNLEYIVLERNGIMGAGHIIFPGSGYDPQLLTVDKKICDAAH